MIGAADDVTNSHEPSYYEIALTNRQVIVAFVVLLLCLVAAFFSGVWIGRESGARAATEQMVRNAPPGEAKGEKKDGQNLEEFEFFDQGKNGKAGEPGAKAGNPPSARAAATTAAAPAPPPPAPAPSTLVQDVGGDTEAGAGTHPPAHPQPAPATERIGAARPQPGTTRAARRAAGTTAPGTPETAGNTAGSTEPAHAAGQVVIQVFSSAEKDQAERIRDRLVSGGHHAYLSPVEVAGRTMYRVRIGPFGSRDKAQKTAEQVRKGFKLDTWVTE